MKRSRARPRRRNNAATLAALWLFFTPPAFGQGPILCPDAAEAEKGSIVDMYAFGRAYDEGYCGIAADKKQAADWYRKAAKAGHSLAAYELGETYFTADGLPADYPAAKKWYLVAAQKGHGPSALRLGFLNAEAHFEGLKPDFAEAEKWFLAAAQQDAGDAKFRLGNFYANYREPRDPAKAVVWLKSAAEGGHRTAMYDLARLLQAGKGVARNAPLALAWMIKAAEAGVLPARMTLAGMYATGDGVEKNVGQAVRWTLTVANDETASPFWLNKAGDIFFEGWEGVPRNYPMARRYYERAAKKSDPHAKERMAEIYEQGLGVEKDQKKAAEYKAQAKK